MKKQQKYSPEFKSEALKLITEQNLQQSLAARKLSIPEGTLAGWVAAAKASTQPLAPGLRSASDVMIENVKLRKELAVAQMERDILKKATAYFARESLPCTRL